MRKRVTMVCFVLVGVLGPTLSLAPAAGLPIPETKPAAPAETKDSPSDPEPPGRQG
ncbi:MAG: hypothetical protein ABIF82_04660 [Planctomycetota bacterium]